MLPATLTFCPNCSADMRNVPENLRSSQEQRTQFQIPSFLLTEPTKRRFDEEGIGTGVVWVGLILIALPVVTSNLSPLTLASWVLGVILTGYGIARTRVDRQSMMRSGMVTAAAGLLTLVVMGNHLWRQEQSPIPADPELASLALSPSSEAEELDASLASILTGSNPMFRGAPAHTGVLAGPGIDGNPYRSWRYDTGEDLRSTPAIAGAVAYFGTRDGYLVALDLLTRKPKWTFDLGGYPVTASPAVDGRTVYIGSGFNAFAVDADTGIQRWKSQMEYAGESSPTVADGVVYVASKENHLYAFDAASGEQLWSFKTDGLLFGTPSIAEDAILIGGDDGDLFSISRDNGHLLWKTTLDSAIYSTPAISNGRVFVTTEGQTVSAVDLETGDLIWSYPVGGASSPAVADGIVYVGSSDGALYAIDAESGGTPMWLFATGNKTVQSPVIAGEHVVVAAGAMLYSLDRETGEVVWQYPVGDTITTEPVILDGYLYAGDKNGYFYALTGDAHLATPESGSAGNSNGKPGST
ncbi:MAG: PQQ-binding-like beta-propeller repeat protein [Thermomicrobiales bacterium]